MSDKLSNLLNAIPIPVVFVSKTERIIAENEEARQLLGPNIRSRHYATILRQPMVLESIEACLEEQSAQNANYTINDRQKDNSFRVSCRFVSDTGYDFPTGVIVSFQNMTEFEEVDQIRRDFVANVSHELRSPLTAISGFIETLKGAAQMDPSAQEGFLDLMAWETARMERLVSDLLSLSRVENQERFSPEGSVNLLSILSSAIDNFIGLAAEAQVELKLHSEVLSADVRGDADQLQQVFCNLIENGIRYGGSGGLVGVNVEAVSYDPVLKSPCIQTTVFDKGPGIDSEHLPRLTERFYRADNHRSRHLGGTGLGLAIVKHIVSRHCGRLLVESELGCGARFKVVLPKQVC
ncbi:MAG: ATP-binding protein [Aestuariivita sp.]|nr:ATP-binding protein [Aestuariivita sp.]MCY4201095.1 ATP-binding protein [Aestuariivita sp.]